MTPSTLYLGNYGTMVYNSSNNMRLPKHVASVGGRAQFQSRQQVGEKLRSW